MKVFSFDLPDKIFGFETGLVKVFLLPLPILGLIWLSLQFVILPRINNLKEMNSQVNDIQKQIKSTQEKIGYLSALDKNELDKDANYLNNALLREKNTYLLVKIVRTIAESYGFNVKSFLVTPGTLKSSGTEKKAPLDVVTKIPVALVIVGPKSKYMELILALEKSLPVLVVDSFDLKSSGDVAEVSLKISSFFVEDRGTVNINNVSLTDLTLKKEELDVLTKLGQFNIDSKVLEIQAGEKVKKELVKYVRENPFSL